MSTEIKTQYFKENALPTELKARVPKLVDLSEKTLTEILDWFEGREAYPRFDSSDIREIAERTHEAGDSIANATSVLRFFIDRMVQSDDSPLDFYEDLISLGVVDTTQQSRLRFIFERLPSVVKWFVFFRRQLLTQGYGQARLTGSTMSAALKPVFRHAFRYGIDKLEQYNPQPIGYAIVGQIELEREDCSLTFSFQVNRDTLNRLISDLLALQAQMEQLRVQTERLMHNVES